MEIHRGRNQGGGGNVEILSVKQSNRVSGEDGQDHERKKISGNKESGKSGGADRSGKQRGKIKEIGSDKSGCF